MVIASKAVSYKPLHICPLPFRMAYLRGLKVSSTTAPVVGKFFVWSSIQSSHSSYWLQNVMLSFVTISKQAWSYFNLVPLQLRMNAPTFSKLPNIFSTILHQFEEYIQRIRTTEHTMHLQKLRFCKNNKSKINMSTLNHHIE